MMFYIACIHCGYHRNSPLILCYFILFLSSIILNEFYIHTCFYDTESCHVLLFPMVPLTLGVTLVSNIQNIISSYLPRALIGSWPNEPAKYHLVNTREGDGPCLISS